MSQYTETELLELENGNLIDKLFAADQEAERLKARVTELISVLRVVLSLDDNTVSLEVNGRTIDVKKP